MEQPVDLAIVFVDTKDDDRCKKHLDQINLLLSVGYELYGNPLPLSASRIAYSLLRPEIKPRINMVTAYPTDRQLGYITWAYNASVAMLEELKPTKQECSLLIEYHKETLKSVVAHTPVLVQKLKELRGGKHEPAPEDEYEDDIPFNLNLEKNHDNTPKTSI